jgi:hypothetical protein
MFMCSCITFLSLFIETMCYWDWIAEFLLGAVRNIACMHLYLVSNSDYFTMTVATTLFKWPTFSSLICCSCFLVLCLLSIITAIYLTSKWYFQVVSEYRKRGIEFLLQAINHPTYLEDLTGLTEYRSRLTLLNWLGWWDRWLQWWWWWLCWNIIFFTHFLTVLLSFVQNEIKAASFFF